MWWWFYGGGGGWLKVLKLRSVILVTNGEVYLSEFSFKEIFNKVIEKSNL